MGSFFTNVHIRASGDADTAVTAIVQCLTALATEKGLVPCEDGATVDRGFLVGAAGAWVGIHDQATESQDVDLLDDLARRLLGIPEQQACAGYKYLLEDGADGVWLGPELLARVDRDVLASLCIVEPVGETLRIVLREGASLDALEEALAPLLPSRADGMEASRAKGNEDAKALKGEFGIDFRASVPRREPR